ncbi:MAG: chemotaxis protein CheW [Thioalkalivibrionaceae bacterium]
MIELVDSQNVPHSIEMAAGSRTVEHPFGWLFAFERSIESRYPERVQRAAGWRGVLIELDGASVLVDMERLVELIELPRLTRVPLAESWVLGLANLRGAVLPVFDLAVLLKKSAGDDGSARRGADADTQSSASRFDAGANKLRQVLVTGRSGQPETWVGFAIGRYRGVRQCAPSQRQREVASSLLKGLAHGGFVVDDEAVPVLDIERLLDERERFLRPLRQGLVVGAGGFSG